MITHFQVYVYLLMQALESFLKELQVMKLVLHEI